MCVCVQIKKRCAKEWAEAEKALLQAEKIEQDTNATKADVEKVHTHTIHTHTIYTYTGRHKIGRAHV